ncbi:MAG TPA: type I-U CRISPR-associated protein Csb2 [Xanthobacteraceae bacterium]|jgi:CRISPR-associated protein Csb2|nr:type I-U CRISPR-associated protein Csb2 [Xanthobacteraceae bacterium]
MSTLLLRVRFHDGRYHGSGVWPPSPARLFQALIAGAACGEKLSDQVVKALNWLEGLDAPIIAAPSAYPGRPFKNFVPNNDLDAVGGDPDRIGEIRTAKNIRPHLFNAAVPLIYAWTFEDGADAERHARTICQIADKLYQLGRGIDMAWAAGEIVADAAEVEARFRAHGGVWWSPNERGDGETLLCPHRGSLASLTVRFNKTRGRFERIGQGKKASLLFAQAPKPNFKPVPYNSPSTFLLFDIRNGSAFAPQPFDRIVALTERIRDLAAQQLKASAWRREDPKREVCIERVFIGRDASEADKARRIRIAPLPSIGHAQAERSIRRVLVTIPPDCSIATGDVAWAFSGLAIGSDKETGEIIELVTASDRTMLEHYGVNDAAPARLWRTVTPAALPERAARRRIDPCRMREEAKDGAERARENAAAESAVRQALRHAGVETPAQAIRAQREPFEGKGQRAEAFAKETRFAKERLWHVEVSFAQAVRGPLLIGDGRYLGLGLMARVRRTEGIFAFAIMDGLTDQAKPLALARALRRAVMARVQEKIGRETLPAFFTGHAVDGTPLRPGRHEHLAFIFDTLRKRLLIVAPHILARRDPSKAEREWYLPLLEDAVAGFQELRAGPAGKLVLAPTIVEQSDDPLFTPSPIWESVTPYRVTRHARLRDAAAAVEADILAECLRAGFPQPRIAVSETFGKRGLGLFGRAQLTFRTAVAGPLILGRDRHFGGGLFAAVG